MDSEERITNAVLRKEVDRVPTFESLIDEKVIESITPGGTLDEFIYKMDIDGVVVSPDYNKEEIGPNVFKDEWGNTIEYTSEKTPISKGCINTLDDFKNFESPDPKAPYRFKTLENAVKRHSGKKSIIVHMNDVLSIPRNLLGYENLFINIASNPDLIKELIKFSVEYNLSLAEEVVKRGVRIIMTGDDYAYGKGLLMSPRSFEELFYPGFCRVIKGFKELGLLVIKHSDGNIWPILDKFVDAGIDCIDPVEPTAGMDIKTIKEIYGNRISIKGNVDCSLTLTFGTREQVREETLKCLKDGAPGNGFILSSSNSIHSGVKPENYITMLETLKEFGNYPLNFL
jgi:uroporphyrinogen decarboxylase